MNVREQIRTGFEIVEQCALPDVAGRTELDKLVGQKICCALHLE